MNKIPKCETCGAPLGGVYAVGHITDFSVLLTGEWKVNIRVVLECGSCGEPAVDTYTTLRGKMETHVKGTDPLAPENL